MTELYRKPDSIFCCGYRTRMEGPLSCDKQSWRAVCLTCGSIYTVTSLGIGGRIVIDGSGPCSCGADKLIKEGIL